MCAHVLREDEAVPGLDRRELDAKLLWPRRQVAPLDVGVREVVSVRARDAGRASGAFLNWRQLVEHRDHVAELGAAAVQAAAHQAVGRPGLRLVEGLRAALLALEARLVLRVEGRGEVAVDSVTATLPRRSTRRTRVARK